MEMGFVLSILVLVCVLHKKLFGVATIIKLENWLTGAC